MKSKIFIIMLICALTLTACGAPGEAESADSQTPSAAAQEALTALARSEYVSVAFMPESYTDPSGIAVDESVLVRSDGRTPDTEAQTEVAAEAAQARLFDAESWPVNEYTDGLPMPDEGSVSMSGEDAEAPGCFSIIFEGMSYESFLEYVESLKAAGYTANAVTEDYADYGMDGLMYTASGPDGRTISAMSVSGTTVLQIFK